MKRKTKYFETPGKHIIFSSIFYKEWSFVVRTKVKHSTHYIFLSTWCERNIRPYFKSDTFYPVSAMTKLSFIYFQYEQSKPYTSNKNNRTQYNRCPLWTRNYKPFQGAGVYPRFYQGSCFSFLFFVHSVLWIINNNDPVICAVYCLTHICCIDCVVFSC